MSYSYISNHLTLLQGSEPSGRMHTKTTRIQLSFGAKQSSAASESGLSRAVAFSRDISVFLEIKFNIHPFVHSFTNIS